MDIDTKISLDRADNELLLAKAIHLLSKNSQVKKEIFNLPEETTFYSAVISHAYYGIFYITKAYLISKGISIPEQGQHNAVYQKFKQFARKGEIDKELLEIYSDLRIKAETLLEIFDKEGENRTIYTYHKLPQANKEPAEESIGNSQFFISHMKSLIQKRDKIFDKRQDK